MGKKTQRSSENFNVSKSDRSLPLDKTKNYNCGNRIGLNL